VQAKLPNTLFARIFDFPPFVQQMFPETNPSCSLPFFTENAAPSGAPLDLFFSLFLCFPCFVAALITVPRCTHFTAVMNTSNNNHDSTKIPPLSLVLLGAQRINLPPTPATVSHSIFFIFSPVENNIGS
jgi:hypothetical protein